MFMIGDVKQSLLNSKLVEKKSYLAVTEVFNDNEISVAQTVPKVSKKLIMMHTILLIIYMYM